MRKLRAKQGKKSNQETSCCRKLLPGWIGKRQEDSHRKMEGGTRVGLSSQSWSHGKDGPSGKELSETGGWAREKGWRITWHTSWPFPSLPLCYLMPGLTLATAGGGQPSRAPGQCSWLGSTLVHYRAQREGQRSDGQEPRSQHLRTSFPWISFTGWFLFMKRPRTQRQVSWVSHCIDFTGGNETYDKTHHLSGTGYESL